MTASSGHNLAGNNLARKRYTYEWYVVVICMLAYVFSFVDRQVLALMIEPIKRDLHLTDTQFSLLHGFAFSLFYAVMGMPLAYLADRFARPRIISIGVALWSVATAACGLSQNFVHMFFARMSVGVGEAALSPGTYSMLADYFPKEKLGRAVAIYSLGSFIGGGIAFLIGGYVIALLKHTPTLTLPVLGDMHAWQLTFFIVGLPGLLVALIFALTVRDPQRKGLVQDSAGEVKRVSMPDALRFIAAHGKTFFCHYIGFSFYAMTLFCLMSWTPAFYIRRFGLTPVEAGYTLGTVLLIANTTGVFCGGWFNDWLLRKGHSDAPMRAGFIGAVCMLIPSVAFTQVGSLGASLALLVLAMFFASFPMPTSTAAMQTLAPNQMRAQISAVFLLVSNLIALGAGTTIVALITDKVFASPLAVGHSMAIVNLVASALAAVLLWIGCKQFRASLAREASNRRANEPAEELATTDSAAPVLGVSVR
ncbi:MFS transporter [Paraburkholderia sp. PGU16]|jgi:MFS family permease|uniref:MFS transporter n=1 Tax=Paraburkholderia largidicola TaxID=3014751 RepID=A0A7I8BZR5_9BURK|nr:MFS transporter [Paraburkholderia sp. PGU16]BCF93440.1 MFS transporter [Paraburkholderia sp. PGU16]BEU26617.1 MFS transporter [Paraburkholderia sp. 22B1P]